MKSKTLAPESGIVRGGKRPPDKSTPILKSARHGRILSADTAAAKDPATVYAMRRPVAVRAWAIRRIGTKKPLVATVRQTRELALRELDHYGGPDYYEVVRVSVRVV